MVKIVDPIYRPAEICAALLAALEASEGRRRSRKRDQTPDEIGLSLKRHLLECAIEEDPDPEAFESWLLQRGAACNATEMSGAVSAMARAIFEDWRLAHVNLEFKSWLDHGAPSDDAIQTSNTALKNETGHER